MEWMAIIGDSVQYIEDHITEDISAENIAKAVGVSPFYFQKGFAMLCGFSVAEYIRNRKLALAGNDLLITDDKVIDIAMKYGYDSPDSFTKAFTRFHGVSPSSVRKDEVLLKTFAPLKLKISLEGGYLMDYTIVKKDAFTVIANAKTFPYEGAKEIVPQFWQEHYQAGMCRKVLLQKQYLHLIGQYFLAREQCQMLFKMLIRRFIQNGCLLLKSMSLLPDTA